MHASSRVAFAVMTVGQSTGLRTESGSIVIRLSKPLALFARKHSGTMRSGTENTAAMPAILLRDITEVRRMTKEQFKRETLYRATMRAVNQLRDTGIISEYEYEKCREMLLEKYNPPIGKIVSN